MSLSTARVINEEINRVEGELERITEEESSIRGRLREIETYRRHLDRESLELRVALRSVRTLGDKVS